MQAIVETLFDAAYLSTVITLRGAGGRCGCLMKKSISFPVQKSASESTLRRSKSGLDAVGRVTAAPDR